MQFYSTNNKQHIVNLSTAIFQSLPPDNGLYMPCKIPQLDKAFIDQIENYSFAAIAFNIAQALLENDVEKNALKKIIDEAINFPAPLVEIGKDIFVLELFHGPSLAFKDFGARFMSRLMAYFLEKESKEIHVLVATSGDTGGAVALGFYDVPGIRVTILYPSGKVSPIQEKQLTTLGKNITALEVEGTFDDCQKLVKQAFLDKALNEKFNLSSANSINIARLIPQTFYYFNAVAQLKKIGNNKPVYFSVPSGNFGNLTAGLIAQKMGLPVQHFIASTNINDEVPEYLSTGKFTPRPSLHTLSNAMDVGHPSNFARMLDLFDHNVATMRKHISGYSFTDGQTVAAIKNIFAKNNYVMCPHTAVAYLGLQQFIKEKKLKDYAGIFLSTAHACKFPDVYDKNISDAISLSPQVKTILRKEKKAIKINNYFLNFKKILLSNDYI